MAMFEPNVEMETSSKRITGNSRRVNESGSLFEKISWIVLKKERPPKSSYYPLPPRK
ncbi:hypothetical protein [Sporosarcina beigongshangi]|uniref:hypothetical protein n=1 Tax=Sporosarcina beigongshangi TaxID=2782538 RepID=UPI00193A2286|nr:hypothetical protein [Sporosarcina beigongshangi]